MKIGIGLFACTLLAQAQPLAVVHVTLVDVEAGRTRLDMTVIVDGARISAVGEAARLAPPRGARILDGRGKFLIPGLWDMHVHMFSSLPPGPDDPAPRGYFAPSFVSHGIVGVRSMCDDLGAIRKLRAAVSAGTLAGPEVVSSGPILDGPQPYWPGGSIACAGAAEAREAVRRVKRDGADFVKVYSLLPRDAYLAIADEAKKAGLPFAGHLPNSVTAAEASDAGQKSMEHLMGVPEDPALYARFVKNGTWQTPTLTALRAAAYAGDPTFENDPRLASVLEPIRQFWKPLLAELAGRQDVAARKTGFERELRMVGSMHRAGVKILAGTDTPNPFVFPGSGLHDELALLVKAGLSPIDALRSATIRAAEYLGRSDRSGSIAAGKDADLILLDADPTADIDNTRRIAAVLVKGRPLD